MCASSVYKIPVLNNAGSVQAQALQMIFPIENDPAQTPLCIRNKITNIYVWLFAVIHVNSAVRPQRGHHNAFWELILYFPEVLLDWKDNSCGHTHQPEEAGTETFMEIFVMGDGEIPSAWIWTFSPLSCHIKSYNTRGGMVAGLRHRTDENVKDLHKTFVRG